MKAELSPANKTKTTENKKTAMTRIHSINLIKLKNKEVKTEMKKSSARPFPIRRLSPEPYRTTGS